MITIEQFMQAIKYRITEGTEYCWDCYGSNARYITSDDEHYSASIIFDSLDHTVYEATICDYVNDRAYRLLNPETSKQMSEESKQRLIDHCVAWDSVNYVDLESIEDWMEKISAVINKQPYDDRVVVPLDLSDQELLVLMKMAHERDVTFNQFIETVLWEKLKSIECAAPKIKANKIKKYKKKNTELSD
jgi:hypothetical protein